MSGYVLTYRGGMGVEPADGSMLSPDTLGTLESAALAEVTMPVGRTRPPLRHLFDIDGGPGPTLRLRHVPPLARLGALMRGGTLIVEGDAGDDLGASLVGGLVRVHGRAGHRAGGPDYTQGRGMTGGEIVIDGDAGDHAGFRMRGGLLAIGGSCGASPGYRMLAGTIVLGRGPLDHPGLAMRRGTIVCLDGATPLRPGPSFAEEGHFGAADLVVLRLVLARLRALAVAVDERLWSGSFRLWSGDRLELNRGEIWQYLGGT